MTEVWSADWVLPVDGEPIRDGAVAFADGVIEAVGPAEALGAGRRFDGAVILPGLVNAHTHIEYATFAGFGDGLTFAPWLMTHIERKARQEPGDALAIARLGAAQCLATGFTTIGDASFSGAAAQACAEAGLKAIVYLEVFGDDADAAVRHWQALADERVAWWSGSVRPGVSPHAPYSVSADVYLATRALGVPMMTHVAESRAETEWLLHGAGEMAAIPDLFVEPPGETGTRLLARHGLLGPHLVAAHCVHVDEEEIALLARHEVGVAHCPRSNAILGCGVAPLAELREAGARVGLGTDSPASAPSFDAFEELRAAVQATRARTQRPDALGAADALELATLGAARALGLDGEIGSLTPGKAADLTVVSLRESPYLPWEDPTSAVVFGGSADRVLATLVSGEPRYEKGGFEWHELIDAASSARSRMLRHGAPTVAS